MPRSTQRPLDERLVQVTLQLLAKEGLEGLSLRRIAREAGVSHGAPLRHYASLADLLAEVAAYGFRLLSEAIEKSGAALPPGAGPLARLVAAGRAYVEIAVENPALFALMFRREALDEANESFAQDAPAAFEQLVRHVRAAQDAGWHASRDTRLLAGAMWAAVHGLATLWAKGAFASPIPGASLDDAFDMTIGLFIQEPKGDTA